MPTQKFGLDYCRYFKPEDVVPAGFVPLLESTYYRQNVEGIRVLLEFAFGATLAAECREFGNMRSRIQRLLTGLRVQGVLDPDYFSLLEDARKTGDGPAFRALLDVIAANPPMVHSPLDIC